MEPSWNVVLSTTDPDKYTESWTIEREGFYQKLIDNELFLRKLGETCQKFIIKMVNEESKNQKEENHCAAKEGEI